MKDEHITRARLLPDGSVVRRMPDGTQQPLESRTDWARLEAMTEDEIEAAALSDPDNPPLAGEELARMRRVPDPRAIRQQLGMTQEQFAVSFQIPVGTLRDWEQRTRRLDGTAKAYLRVIEKAPQAVIQALEAAYEKAEPR